MTEMTETRWKEVMVTADKMRSHSLMPANYAFTLEVIEYAQSLRQKNENWQKAYIRITEILGKIPGGIDKLLDSIDAEPFDEETVQRMLGKIRGEIPIKKTSKPQQEQPDDS